MRPYALLRFIALTSIVSAVGCAAGAETIFLDKQPDGGVPVSLPLGDAGGDADAGKVSNKPVSFEALFGPPESDTATPGDIFGLWAGTDSAGDDMRLLFAASEVTIAKRCDLTSTTKTTVGLTVAARVSSSSIKTLESKSTPTTCSIDVKPAEYANCTTSSTTGFTCFRLTGTSLTLSNFGGVSGTFTKLSD